MGEGGTSGSQHYVEIYARLEGESSPAELVTHYGTQLRERGWSLVEQTAGTGLAAQTWRLTEGAGREWYGVLLALAPPGSPRGEMLFRVIVPEHRE